jgi:hypothetical protein
MNLSIELNDLEQELNIYCKAHQCSANEVVRLALKRLFSATVEPKLSPYECNWSRYFSFAIIP